MHDTKELEARRDDAQAHRQALVEQHDEYRERLAGVEMQRQEAEQAGTKAKVRVEALAARLEALEAEKSDRKRGQQAEEHSGCRSISPSDPRERGVAAPWNWPWKPGRSKIMALLLPIIRSS